MKNRVAGLIIIAISFLIGFIIYSFNKALTEIVSTACTHGPACPMWGTIRFQTNISLGIMFIVFLIGLYIFLFGEEEKTIKDTTVAAKGKIYESKQLKKDLTEEEKFVLDKILENEGSILQSEIVEKTNYSKVKVTRILDRLEAKGIIERKRRGMTNLVVLKNY